MTAAPLKAKVSVHRLRGNDAAAAFDKHFSIVRHRQEERIGETVRPRKIGIRRSAVKDVERKPAVRTADHDFAVWLQRSRHLARQVVAVVLALIGDFVTIAVYANVRKHASRKHAVK